MLSVSNFMFVSYLIYIYTFKYLHIFMQLAGFHEPFEDVLSVNLCGFPASHVSLPPDFAYDDCIGFSGTPGLVPSIRWGGVTCSYLVFGSLMFIQNSIDLPSSTYDKICTYLP